MLGTTSQGTAIPEGNCRFPYFLGGHEGTCVLHVGTAEITPARTWPKAHFVVLPSLWEGETQEEAPSCPHETKEYPM